MWQASEGQLSNPQYLELAKQEMRELIEQYGNHPSVFAWSVFNESAAGYTRRYQFFPRHARVHQGPRSAATRHPGR